MYSINNAYKIDTALEYFFAIQHRTVGFIDKSRWIISLEEEFNCFMLSYKHNWLDKQVGWGLHINDEHVCFLGENCVNEKLKIAKFVDKEESGIWHGYPADYLRHKNDRPSTSVLTDWVKRQLIDKSSMSRIMCCKGGNI